MRGAASAGSGPVKVNRYGAGARIWSRYSGGPGAVYRRGDVAGAEEESVRVSGGGEVREVRNNTGRVGRRQMRKRAPGCRHPGG